MLAQVCKSYFSLLLRRGRFCSIIPLTEPGYAIQSKYVTLILFQRLQMSWLHKTCAMTDDTLR